MKVFAITFVIGFVIGFVMTAVIGRPLSPVETLLLMALTGGGAYITVDLIQSERILRALRRS